MFEIISIYISRKNCNDIGYNIQKILTLLRGNWQILDRKHVQSPHIHFKKGMLKYFGIF